MPKTELITSTPRCDSCHLYSCVHKTTIGDRIQSISLGEHIGVPVEDPIQKPKCNNCGTIQPGTKNIKCFECGLPFAINYNKQTIVLPSKEVYRWIGSNRGARTITKEYGKASITSDGQIIILWPYNVIQRFDFDKIITPDKAKQHDVIWNLFDVEHDKRSIIPPTNQPNTSIISTTTHPIENGGALDIEPTIDPQSVVMFGDGNVCCSYCKKSVVAKYINEHYRVHIKEFVPRPMIVAKPISAPATNIPATQGHRPYPSYSTPITSIQSSKYRPEHQSSRHQHSVKASEHFQYRKIADVSATSSSSNDGRFWDFATTFWLEGSYSSYSGGYMGGSWSTLKEFPRLVIHITFDSVDEYYDLSASIIKRATYSNHENIDEKIPERFCMDMKELSDEIRRAMLYFRVSPKGAYKRFLKLMRSEMETASFPIIRNDKGFVVGTETSNHSDLFDQLSKKQEEAKTENDHFNRYCID